MATLAGKRIALGITGGIAAYKSAYLLRELVGQGAEVTCLLTEGARHFIGAVGLAALSGRPVVRSGWELAGAGSVGHVELAATCEAIVVAPATADFIARTAAGRADDALGLVVLDSRAPVLLAPAMEEHMWRNPQQHEALACLLGSGRFAQVGPGSGPLASGRSGVGRMAEPEEILAALQRLLAPQDLVGRGVIVTAGATREPLDPVRCITNGASGRMGVALAAAAWRRGACVTLIGANLRCPVPAALPLTEVRTTAELHTAVLAALGAHRGPGAPVLVMAAAPSDFMVRRPAPHKLPKLARQPLAAEAPVTTASAREQGRGGTADPALARGGPATAVSTGDEPGLTVTLVPTPDILSDARRRFPGAWLCGFAAETHDLLAHAADKLARKGLQAIVANDVSQPEVGLGAADNAATLLFADGARADLPRQPKEQLADALWDLLAPRLPPAPRQA